MTKLKKKKEKKKYYVIPGIVISVFSVNHFFFPATLCLHRPQKKKKKIADSWNKSTTGSTSTSVFFVPGILHDIILP